MSNLSEEEKEKYYKLAIEIGEIIGKYGNDEQIEFFEKFLDDYKYKNGEYFKLQKENEELKEEIKLKSFIDLEKYSKLDIISVLGKEYVSKDKIKDKIKELEKQCETELLTTWLEAKIDVLKELLGE